MYFLTSTNRQSWFNYLTGYLGGLATIGEGSWYVVWWCDVSTFSSLTCLLISLLLIYCNSYYHQIATANLVAMWQVSIDCILYTRVYFLTSTNRQSCLIYLTGFKGNVTIGEGSWYVCSNWWNMNNKSSFSSLMHSLLLHNSNAYKACAGKGFQSTSEGESNLSLILMIAKISF